MGRSMFYPVVITARYLSRMNGKGYKVECRNCETEFNLQEEVMRHRTSAGPVNYWLHKECYERLWI